MSLKELKEWLQTIREEQSSHQYPVDFKKAVAAYINRTGVPASRVAESLGLYRTVILKWHKKFGVKEENPMRFNR